MTFHPQTTGKVERFQQTLKKWLRRQPLPHSLEELQQQLDEFCHVYNYERPHQGIGRITPSERWNAGTPAGPSAEPLEHPTPPRPVLRNLPVDATGKVRVDKFAIQLGAPYIGQNATVIIDAHHANIYINDLLVRHLKLDHSRRYQPSGKSKGGPRQPRMAS